MTTVESVNTQDWKYKEAHVEIGRDMKIDYTSPLFVEVLEAIKIPKTFASIDRYTSEPMLPKFLQSATPAASVDIVTQDGAPSAIVKPGYKFFTDEEMEPIYQEMVVKVGQPVKRGNKLDQSHFYTSDDSAKETLLKGDHKFGFSISRQAHGGIQVSLSTLRLVCTNGMVVRDNAYNALFRDRLPTMNELNTITSKMADFEFEEFYKKHFVGKDGKFVKASVEEYRNVRQICSSEMEDEQMELVFPLTGINRFYEANGLKLTGTPAHLRRRLSAGITFYDLVNIATNLTSNVTKDLKAEVALSNLVHRRRDLSSIYNAPKGEPVFSEEALHNLTGDYRKMY